MIKWTTPSITLKLNGVYSGDFYITLKQITNEVTITDPSISYEEEETILSFSLTQEQSGLFAEGSIKLQVNIVNGEDRKATDIVSISSLANLIDEVIE